MDHLFSFEETQAIEVPVYNPVRRYVGPFHSFPQREGLDRKSLLELGDHQGRKPEDIASFFQCWLYFGLLKEFFAEIVEFDEFDFKATNEDGSQVITTAHLHRYLRTWAKKIGPLCTQDTEFEDKLISSVGSLFAEVYSAGQYFIGDGRGWPHDPAVMKGVPAPLALSIMVLVDALTKTVRQVTKYRVNYDWQTSKFLIDKMASDGWCRSELNFLARLKIDTLYSASTMTRPSRDRNHSNCTAHCCLTEQVTNYDSYLEKRRKHAEGCAGSSGCVEVKVDPMQLKDLIIADSVPLIYYDTAKGSLEIESTQLGEGNHSKSYIALSHVCKYISCLAPNQTVFGQKKHHLTTPRGRWSRKPLSKQLALMPTNSSPTTDEPVGRKPSR
jgi:hypothetical protein